MPSKVSSISPPVEEKPKIRFNFLEKNSVIDSYQSYAKEGFDEQRYKTDSDLSAIH
jgi:hypothetical protein